MTSTSASARLLSRKLHSSDCALSLELTAALDLAGSSGNALSGSSRSSNATAHARHTSWPAVVAGAIPLGAHTATATGGLTTGALYPWPLPQPLSGAPTSFYRSARPRPTDPCARPLSPPGSTWQQLQLQLQPSRLHSQGAPPLPQPLLSPSGPLFRQSQRCLWLKQQQLGTGLDGGLQHRQQRRRQRRPEGAERSLEVRAGGDPQPLRPALQLGRSHQYEHSGARQSQTRAQLLDCRLASSSSAAAAAAAAAAAMAEPELPQPPQRQPQEREGRSPASGASAAPVSASWEGGGGGVKGTQDPDYDDEDEGEDDYGQRLPPQDPEAQHEEPGLMFVFGGALLSALLAVFVGALGIVGVLYAGAAINRAAKNREAGQMDEAAAAAAAKGAGITDAAPSGTGG